MFSLKTAAKRFAQAYAEELGRTSAKATIFVLAIICTGLISQVTR